MGTACLTMKVVAALVTLALHQATADWSGSGELACYGHVSTDVSSPEGGDHLGEGTMRCNIIEWGGGPLGPEAMFFKPNSGAEFEIWAWDYRDWDSEHWPMPYATCATDLVQEGRHGSGLLHTSQGLHWLWIWQLRGRHCLYRLLRSLFLFPIFSLKENMEKRFLSK